MTTALAIAILGTVNKLIDLYALMLTRASDEDAATLMRVIAEREAWWQEHLWEPLGNWIASLDGGNDA